jgi:hypothetical protein
MTFETTSDHVKHMLKQRAQTHAVLKRGEFDVTTEDGRLIVEWSHDQRTERFMVKEPVTPRETQGTITDVMFRLKQRLVSPTVLNRQPAASPKPVKPLNPAK